MFMGGIDRFFSIVPVVGSALDLGSGSALAGLERKLGKGSAVVIILRRGSRGGG